MAVTNCDTWEERIALAASDHFICFFGSKLSNVNLKIIPKHF